MNSRMRHPVDFNILSQNPHTNWKKEGIQLKFEQMIHDTCPEDWDLEKFVLLSEKIQTFVETLEIHHMRPLKKHEHRYVDEPLDYAPVEVCHHGSLEFLNKLTNLKELSQKYVPNDRFRDYTRESYECSYEDIENLSK